ncbi:MAG: histidine-type phosphatase [Prevotella sp.]|nr:histidine-type phosphatase [Prevotella sp.]
MMKRILTNLLLVLLVTSAWAQRTSAISQLQTDPRKAYGMDYPYSLNTAPLTKAPDGYVPFYVSHYGRHGSRYYWTDKLYRELDTLLTDAHNRHNLTAEGEAFYERYMAVKDELLTGMGELTQLGWNQHQGIARAMYDNFPEVFNHGGYVSAVSSLSGRCVISMSAFCLALMQRNPAIDIREQSSRFTLDGVVPMDRQNPVKHHYPKVRPNYEKNRDQFSCHDQLRRKAVERVFVNTDSLHANLHHTGSNLINLYTSLPSIGHEGLMGNIITDAELVDEWETSNLGSYSWVFAPQYEMIPILEDFIRKADAVIDGSSNHLADLRFGHDNCLGPLTVLMGINGADRNPDDPNEVKDCYQNWETCKASNLQLVLYRSARAADDVLVKCLLNGEEAVLPVPTDSYPYYKWADFRSFYKKRCESVSTQ